MATITAIDATSNCEIIGGVTHAYMCDYAEIDGVTVSSGVITNFTMANTGRWARMNFDDEDNVAFFNEEGELQAGAVKINGSGLMKFNGLSQAKITAANGAKACCGVVVVWVGTDGVRRVQGIDVAPDDSWSFSKVKPRVVPNGLSDTGENSTRLEYNIAHEGRYLSPTTTLDDAALEAL